MEYCAGDAALWKGIQFMCNTRRSRVDNERSMVLGAWNKSLVIRLGCHPCDVDNGHCFGREDVSEEMALGDP